MRRRLLEISAGLGLVWIASQAVARADAPLPPPPRPEAYDSDDALPAHADPVASYTLQVSLDPHKHDVTGKGTITWRNASRVPQKELFLHLYLNAFKNERSVFMRFPSDDAFRGMGAPTEWGWITVKHLKLPSGEDLWPARDRTSPGDAEDETDIRVPLPTAVAPGDSLVLDVEFTSHLPSLSFRTGYFGGFHLVGQWFPKIAKIEPDGRWGHFTFHHLSEFYADFGRYDVTIDTPEGVVVGATGQPEGEVREGGRVKRRFVQDDVHDFAFTAWDRFEEMTALSEDGIALRVLYPKGHDRDAREELEEARYGLQYLGKAYGRYPYKTLTLVHPPDGADEAGGMEYPTLITTGGPWYLPWTGARVLDALVIHELGHQWFYGLVATDEHTYPFLDEGLNSYAEADALEARFPHSSGARALGISVGIPAYNRAGAAETERNAPVAQPASDFLKGGDYGALVYARTATIMGTLANVYGEDAVRRAVGRYTRKYRFQHPGPKEFLQTVSEVVGEDAAEQLELALFERGTVDYTVADLQSEADETPKGIFGDPDAPSKPNEPGTTDYHGTVLVRRRGALRFPVEVEMIGKDGESQRVVWDAADSAKRLPYHGKSQLVAAVIDPDHKVLLDDDLSNNAMKKSPSRLSGALLDRFLFGVEVALGGVLP